MRGDQKRAWQCYHASTRSEACQQKKADTPPSRSRHGGMICTSYPSNAKARIPRGWVIYRQSPDEDIPLNRFLRRALNAALKKEQKSDQLSREHSYQETSLHRQTTRPRGNKRWEPAYEPFHPSADSEQVRNMIQHLKLKENPGRWQGYLPLVPEVHTPGPTQTAPTYREVLVGNPRVGAQFRGPGRINLTEYWRDNCHQIGQMLYSLLRKY